MDVNSPKPELLLSEQGTIHPLRALKLSAFLRFLIAWVLSRKSQRSRRSIPYVWVCIFQGHPARVRPFMTEEAVLMAIVWLRRHIRRLCKIACWWNIATIWKRRGCAAIVPDRFRNERLGCAPRAYVLSVEGVAFARLMLAIWCHAAEILQNIMAKLDVPR